MKITDLLKKEGVLLNQQPADKNAAIDILVGLHDKVGNLNDKAGYKKAIEAREAQGSTAVGMGIAVPHAKTDAAKQPGLVAMTVPGGVDYGCIDGTDSNLFFMIAAPAGAADTHLEVLANLMTMLMDPEFSGALVAAKSVDEFLALIDDKEADRFGKEEAAAAPAAAAAAPANGTKVVGVTACPTGIAHTYMAAEALEQTGTKKGVDVKVETQGSGGAKNVLTADDIKAADVVIIAADKNVDLGRFDGKKLIKASTADAIHRSEGLIDRAIAGDAPVYQLGGGIMIALAFLLDDYSIDPSNFGSNTPVAAWFKSIGGTAFGFMLPVLAGFIARSIADRPALVVGFVGGALAASGSTFASPGGGIPSAFLGALVAGFAAGFIVKGLQKVCDKLPASLEGIKPVLIYPLFGTLLIGVLMCLINPIVGALNTWISNVLMGMSSGSSVVLGLILGAMMATDMGGPLNKAAYVFGTAALANQNEIGYMIMAAVMVGGMVPPLAIAISTMVSKQLQTRCTLSHH